MRSSVITDAENPMRPVLKWAGGKTQLLDAISARMPTVYNDYYEPFIGGGSVLLFLRPEKAYINDTNEQLINLYIQIRDNAESVIEVVTELDSSSCDKEMYYRIRERYNTKITSNELDFECAALMIWINKHCFNGLYRVNGKGTFNVPYNNRIAGNSIDDVNLMRISEYLRGAEVQISCSDFEDACKNVEENDFVYFDSPYVPQSETADFTDYTKDGFSLRDHERLADLFRRLDRIGAKVMLSNNDVQLVHELYSGYEIQHLDVRRMINSNASRRKGREVLITNY